MCFFLCTPDSVGRSRLAARVYVPRAGRHIYTPRRQQTSSLVWGIYLHRQELAENEALHFRTCASLPVVFGTFILFLFGVFPRDISSRYGVIVSSVLRTACIKDQYVADTTA